MSSRERAPEQSPGKHLVVKPRQSCWHEVLRFLKCRLVFQIDALGGSLCALGRCQERPLSLSDDCPEKKILGNQGRLGPKS